MIEHKVQYFIHFMSFIKKLKFKYIFEEFVYLYVHYLLLNV